MPTSASRWTSTLLDQLKRAWSETRRAHGQRQANAGRTMERFRVAAALRQSEERQAFLLALSDALAVHSTDYRRDRARGGADAGRAPGAWQAGCFSPICPPKGPRSSASSSGGQTPSFLGHYSYQQWSTAAESVRRGQTFVAGDVKTALITDHERERWLRYGICSAASVPILRHGKAVASLTVCDTVPRAVGRPRNRLPPGHRRPHLDRGRTRPHRRGVPPLGGRYRLLVLASSEMVYRMSGDWSQMISLEGKNFLADTRNPSLAWLGEYIPESEKSPASRRRSPRPSAARPRSSWSTG